MLALCLMLSGTYYAHFNAGIIRAPLLVEKDVVGPSSMVVESDIFMPSPMVTEVRRYAQSSRPDGQLSQHL